MELSKIDQATLERKAESLGSCLLARGWRFATAESCTGGWIAQAATAVPGSSEWFESGYVTYSNNSKITLLGVDPTLIEKYGAVSGEVAEAMSKGAKSFCKVDCAIAVTGIAGPAGGSLGKPVGTVYFGLATRSDLKVEQKVFKGDRTAVRAQTVLHALGLLTTMVR